MKVPILDLSIQHQRLKSEITHAIEQVMDKTHFILGENVRKLEADIAAYCGVQHGIGVANGSDALYLALLACGIGKGDEVITSAFTFFATAGAIARVGATPVFVDIDPLTFNIDAGQIEAKITAKTKAIMPVQLYGQCSNHEAINRIAANHNLVVIEDAAQAIGAEFQGQKSGSLGTMACFSFFPTKNLGAYGDGGMIVTNRDDLADKLKMLRAHGSKPKYYHHLLGCNSRLDELQAAILNVKFPHLETWIASRQEIARRYDALLAQHCKVVTTPAVDGNNRHVFHQYTIRCPRRDELQAFLKSNGVETMVYYPKPLHLQPVFEYLSYREGDLPETERACDEALSLPMFPELTLEQQEYVVSCIRRFYEGNV
jgi:dTDP-4-amino-4,6-dideoxygalactose transaminase